LGCVVGSQALVISLQVPSPNEPKAIYRSIRMQGGTRA
jgi:hypothetical protein